MNKKNLFFVFLFLIPLVFAIEQKDTFNNDEPVVIVDNCVAINGSVIPGCTCSLYVYNSTWNAVINGVAMTDRTNGFYNYSAGILPSGIYYSNVVCSDGTYNGTEENTFVVVDQLPSTWFNNLWDNLLYLPRSVWNLTLASGSTANQTLTNAASTNTGGFDRLWISVETTTFWYANNTASFVVTLTNSTGHLVNDSSISAGLYYANNSVTNESITTTFLSSGTYEMNYSINSLPTTGMYYLEINATYNSIITQERKAFRITSAGPYAFSISTEQEYCLDEETFTFLLTATNEGTGPAETHFKCWLNNIRSGRTYGNKSWFKQVSTASTYNQDVELFMPDIDEGFYDIMCSYSIPNTQYQNLTPIDSLAYFKTCPSGKNKMNFLIAYVSGLKKASDYAAYLVYKRNQQRIILLLLIIPYLGLFVAEQERKKKILAEQEEEERRNYY